GVALELAGGAGPHVPESQGAVPAAGRELPTVGGEGRTAEVEPRRGPEEPSPTRVEVEEDDVAARAAQRERRSVGRDREIGEAGFADGSRDATGVWVEDLDRVAARGGDCTRSDERGPA